MSQFPPFDSMDPKTMMELSRIVQELPPEKLNRLQTIMHNMMAGFDVRAELEAFEKELPPGFRDQITSLMGAPREASVAAPSPKEISADMDLHQARMTVLHAVATGSMSPEEAVHILFPPDTSDR